MKWLKRIVYLILVLFFLLNVMAIFHAWQFTHFYPDAEKVDLKRLSYSQMAKMVFMGYEFPKSVVHDKPSLPYETINLSTDDNLKISTWFLKNDSSKNAVILFHGHAGTKGSLVSQAEYFYSLGFSTLTIDFRAHGDSDGTTCTVGFNESEEVKLAFDLLKKRGYNNIALYGVSMGAAAIIKAMKDYQLPANKLILEMPFGSLPDAVNGRMRMMGIPPTPIAQLLTFWGGVEQGYWAFDFSPCEYAKSISCPVLLQWGKLDVRVQQREIDCIYENLTSTKQLVVYEGAGHEPLQKFNKVLWESEVSKFLTR